MWYNEHVNTIPAHNTPRNKRIFYLHAS